MSDSAKSLNGENMTIVDIGAGRCPYRHQFRNKYTRYIAVDLPGSLPDELEGEIEFAPGTAESIPLANESADVVLFNQVLEHVEEPTNSLNEIYRILKPNGVLLGSVPHISPVHLEPYDFRRYTDLGLEQALNSSKFSDIDIQLSGSVYSASALLLAMDWVLSRRKQGYPQQFSTSRALFLSPLIGFLNITSSLADFILPNSGRSAANLCWSSKKPDQTSE